MTFDPSRKVQEEKCHPEGPGWVFVADTFDPVSNVRAVTWAMQIWVHVFVRVDIFQRRMVEKMSPVEQGVFPEETLVTSEACFMKDTHLDQILNKPYASMRKKD